MFSKTSELEAQKGQTQDFGTNPISVRETGHYREEYIRAFVNKWDALIDWDARAEAEGSFFIDKLRERGARKILDVATGTGFHSVRMIEAGLDVVSADGSTEMLYKAFENGKKRGHVLRTVKADWRWLNRDIHSKFDAVVCLGNSFTHLFEENDRRKALAEFYAALRHDGVLILDQRNYDAIMDHGYSSDHTYYYCGEDVSVRPSHIDDGLARFEYSFADGEQFHLNMFPLRKEYMRRLMREVGFQNVETLGDFQQTYREEEPDFFIHLAEKRYRLDGDKRGVVTASASYSEPVETARRYYNSDDADRFYAEVWGGEDIHVGIYAEPGQETTDEAIADASRRTVERMLARLPRRHADLRILDLGSGYGGAARHIAAELGCRVVGLNLSDVENRRARELNADRGLDGRIEIIDGSFEAVPFEDRSFDVVWSQDAILHSGDRPRVFAEVARVLRPGGDFVFTDPMQSDDCPAGVLDPILARIHLSSLGSPRDYRRMAAAVGLTEVDFDEQTANLIAHYRRVLAETRRRGAELRGAISADYLANMERGLEHWIAGGELGYLSWGLFHFRAG